MPTSLDGKVAAPMYFGSGAADKDRTGGFVCFNGDVFLLFGEGRWYRKKQEMVNLVEMQASLDLLECAESFRVSRHCDVLNVLGISKLICNFANRVAIHWRHELNLGVR